MHGKFLTKDHVELCSFPLQFWSSVVHDQRKAEHALIKVTYLIAYQTLLV